MLTAARHPVVGIADSDLLLLLGMLVSASAGMTHDQLHVTASQEARLTTCQDVQCANSCMRTGTEHLGNADFSMWLILQQAQPEIACKGRCYTLVFKTNIG